MRILHTSDWHLGKSIEQISRIDEQKEFLDWLHELVEKENIDLVLIAGDVFDTYNPSSASEELFYNSINKLNNRGKRPIIVIAGNHDNPDRLCAASSLAYKNGIFLLGYPYSDPSLYKVETEHIKVIESGAGWFELNIFGMSYNVVIITLPYPSEARLDQVVSDSCDECKIQKDYSLKITSLLSDLSKKFRDDTVNLIVGHLFMRGGKESESERTLQIGGALTVDPSKLPTNAHYTALGHLHRPQKVKDAPRHTYYSGSPLAYSFSEADYCKAVYIVDVEPTSEAAITIKNIDCGKPLKRWIAIGGVEEAIKWCEEGRDQNAWIDLLIHTDRILTYEEQKLLRDLNPGIINIRPIIKTDEELDFMDFNSRENKKINELFCDFYKYKTQTEISEELLGTFLDVLNQTEIDDKNFDMDIIA